VRINDPGISRRHAMLRLRPTPTIVDLGSTNGTIVDDVRSEQADVDDGSIITLGSTRIVFRNQGG
jgi:pSer/pThr/pTyr-binding forkhead associated (FHA) protein